MQIYKSILFITRKTSFIFKKIATPQYFRYICSYIYYLHIVYMNKKIISLKDFEITPNENVIERSQNFQSYIDQMEQFGCKSYWVMARTEVGAKMQIEGYNGEVSAYISNDYLGMSQRPETKEAGINAVLKYGTGASAAQAIGGYLDIHKQLEEGIAKFVGQGDIITGTFSKSFGCVGGFVAASKKLIQYLRYYADSNVFSAAITLQVVASSLKALEHIQTRPEIRKKLWTNVNYLRK